MSITRFEDNHLMAVCEEVFGQKRTNKPGPTSQ
jgi:hypothetical protein